MRLLLSIRTRPQNPTYLPGFDDYIYYTIFNTQLFWRGIPRYGKNIVFEVSDTDTLSQLASYFFRHQPVDKIVVPSNWC